MPAFVAAVAVGFGPDPSGPAVTYRFTTTIEQREFPGGVRPPGGRDGNVGDGGFGGRGGGFGGDGFEGERVP